MAFLSCLGRARCRAALYILLVLLPVGVLAEDGAVGPEPEGEPGFAASSVAEEGTEHSSSSVTNLPGGSSSSVLVPQIVEPLDPWYLPQTSSSSSASSIRRRPVAVRDEEEQEQGEGVTETLPESSGEQEGSKEETEAQDDSVAPPNTEEKARLTRSETRRLTAVKREHLRRAARYQREYRKTVRQDPRGEPEIRVCGLNMQNYGLPQEVKRIIRGPEAKRFARKERALLAAVGDARCDVVAVQGLIGKDPVVAEEGLERFAGKLGERLGGSWRALVGDSNHSFGANAFIVRDDEIDILMRRSYASRLLPGLDNFVEQMFFRGPFEIILAVRGKGSAEGKQLVIMTAHFRNSLNNKAKEAEPARVQMAEAVRKLNSFSQAEIDPENPPIFLVVVDRGAGRYAASSLVLEGALELNDFAPGGPCTLNDRGAAECTERPHRPLALYPLLANNVYSTTKQGGDGKSGFAKQGPGDTLRAKRERDQRAVEIYIMPTDVGFARVNPHADGRFAAGVVPIKGQPSESPLTWVELNW